MMRHIKHRTSQVRDLVFVRDAIFEKSSKSSGQSNLTEGSGSTLAGPAVNFGYEEDSTDFTKGRMMTLPGLTMLQSPIVSRSGQLGRGGHRITGSCTFYCPSLKYIRAIDPVFAGFRFGELESYDKLIDKEIIVHNPNPDDFVESIVSNGEGGYNFTYTFTFVPTTDQQYRPGFQIDRLQFKYKTTGAEAESMTYFELLGKQLAMGGIAGTYYPKINYDCSQGVPASAVSTNFFTMDVPLRMDDGNHFIEYAAYDGAPNQGLIEVEKTGYNGVDFDLDLLDSQEGIHQLVIKFNGVSSNVSADLGFKIKDVYLYKEAEWRIESIKDYRDEYMQIGAVRVRGERTSRRRAYG